MAIDRYIARYDCAQPIGSVLKRILLGVISNASPASEQKALIMIAREERAISDDDAISLISAYGLENA